MMYYPYLRGRQYELLALRELAENLLIGDKIIPVIEPVKPTSTLATTLRTYNAMGKRCAVIMNPEISDFAKQVSYNSQNNKIITEINSLIADNNVIKAYILNTDVENFLKDADDEYLSQTMTVSNSPDGLDEHEQFFSETIPMVSLIPGGAERFRRAIKEPKVLLKDSFNKAQKNADYSRRKDEFFSDDHNFFAEDGYSGFADYSVIGADFSETGFAPLAVAIHIVYFGKKNDLRVHHFVSDSNDDISDPAGKFGEALEKLNIWIKENNPYITWGLNELINCYTLGRYPGLGTVKKYSIMHHLELMSRYLDGEI